MERNAAVDLAEKCIEQAANEARKTIKKELEAAAESTKRAAIAAAGLGPFCIMLAQKSCELTEVAEAQNPFIREDL